MMPVMNGIDACQRIRENPLTRNIPVIVLTARNDRETVMRVAKAGATDCLSKPFSQGFLVERIAKAIKTGHGRMAK
jgi:CheY-like chemotaxis protein